MPHLFKQRDINLITGDLKIFLHAVNGPIDKLDYFNKLAISHNGPAAIELEYSFEYIDMIPEVENLVIQQLELAEKKEINIQLHLSPASLIVHADRLFLQQVLFRLLSALLETNEKRSVISVYVTDSDGKCMIESLSQAANTSSKETKDYFKKHRITNALNASVQQDAVHTVYKYMVEDMGGELVYSFAKNGPQYFRMKFALA